MRPSDFTPGQILASKYRLDRVLGRGAMGLVVSATHLVLGTPVAIKVMLDGGRKDEVHTTRFLREAQVAAQLRSQHTARVLDVGTLEDGAPFIVMEYLHGKDLMAVLKDRGVLPIPEAVGYALEACEALAEAHALGIVHRDIKPANLFLALQIDGKPAVKVVDFGIAKVPDSTATGTADALGSPLFMSPEQIQKSRAVDARSDIWSLGVTLYLMLAGTTPAYREELMPLITAILMDPPTPLSTYRPDVPGPLAAVIMRALEKRPDDRWPNIAMFAEALSRFAAPDHVSYVARIAAVQKVEVTPSRPTAELPKPTDTAMLEAAMAVPPMPALVPEQPPPRARRRAWLGAAAAIAIGAPVSLVLALRAGSDARTEPRPPAPPIAAATAEGATTVTVTPATPPVEPSAPTTASTTTAAPIASATARPAARPPATVKPPGRLPGGSRR